MPDPALWRFLALYGGLFAGFGVASPFLPGLLLEHGLSPAALGVVLAGGTVIRLAAGPFGGRLADRLGRPTLVLSGFCAASAAVALGYGPAHGFAMLLGVSVAHAAVLAPLTPVADALALGSARGGQAFQYGWVRAAGSAAFIAGTLVSGQAVGAFGLDVIVWLNAALLALAAALATTVPDRVSGTGSATRMRGGAWKTLLAIAPFRLLMLAAALVIGSHALHDGFEVIRWRQAGLTAAQSSLLWSLSVASEVLVFSLLGRPLLRRLGPAGAVAVSAAAGIVRWGVAARTAEFSAMALVEPLHGLTFALLHLACMDLIAAMVPASLAATAQAFYATVALGIASAAFTLASGPLYGRFGASAFWAMAALCAAALPVAWLLARRSDPSAVRDVSAELEPPPTDRVHRPEPKGTCP